jgi:branched-chain amino acid transport system ATP-binding protein
VSKPVVRLAGVTVTYRERAVLDALDLVIEQGERVALIGPNGAGKSTLFNLIAGAMRADAGTIRLAGEDVSGLPPHLLFHKGLVRTFQIPRPFARLSALESLMVVGGGGTERLTTAWMGRRRIAEREAELAGRARSVLATLGLSQAAAQPAGQLSGGQKKLLELGRVMMADPRVVLLDEIGAGVNRTLLAELATRIEVLNRERGIAFLVIEHDMDLIARLCDPVIVMAEGRVLTQGSMSEVRADPRVIEAYLGARAADAA